MRILDDHDRGETVEMDLGSTFSVRLKENPTTGYRWIVENTTGLEQISDSFMAGSAIGAAGFRVFQFRASSVGSHELRMRTRREWEGKESVNTQFDASIIVK